MDEQGLRKYARLVLEHAMNPSGALLLKINNGSGGSISVDELTPEEITMADSLVARGVLRHVPAGHGVSTVGGMSGFYGDNMAVSGGKSEPTPVNPKVAHRYPERYVVTSGGSHVAGTFKGDTFHDERPQIRAARRDGTLKTKKW